MKQTGARPARRPIPYPRELITWKMMKIKLDTEVLVKIERWAMPTWCHMFNLTLIGFMDGITNPDLIKRLNDNIPKTVDEMMSVTTAFLKGEVVVANQSRKKGPPTGSITKLAVDDGTEDPAEEIVKDQYEATNSFLSTTIISEDSSQFKREKLKKIKDLVQKLKKLNSDHNKAQTDYIASLCEKTNPNKIYISDILLSSWLLLIDLGCSYLFYCV
ncbi:protein longifolia 1 [Tanacetum coccineum]